MSKFVTYLRTSTGRQNLGIEAQRATLKTFLDREGWPPLAEFVEQESGKRNDRPELGKALALCRATGATLVIAKLDRLARNAAFLMSILDSGVDVRFCDLPSIPAGPTGRFLVQSMAAVAELEAGLISERTKAALKAAKANGVKLGGFRGTAPTAAHRESAVAVTRAKADARAADLKPIIAAARAAGCASAYSIAGYLNDKGILTARKKQWRAEQVLRLLDRI
ncbi:MAG TPA: recombinase family protein [Azospirillaceae bacterium]|nr:recombinase family protein [Azospirillaceae bacterium]